MTVDSTNEERDVLPPDVPTPLPLQNLHIAGVPTNIEMPSEVPVMGSFNGDMKYVKMNGNTLFDGRWDAVELKKD